MTERAAGVVVFAPHFAEYSTRLAIALAKRGPVLLILDRDNHRMECGEALMREARSALNLFEFASASRIARIKSRFLIVFRIVLFRPAIVNVQEQVDSVTAWAVRIFRHFHPIVLTVHDPKPHTGKDTAWVVANAANRRAIRAAASIFHVHGRYCRDQLIDELGFEPPIVGTAHGAILVPRAEQIRQPENGRILMFGRMEAYKGLDVLLDAVDALHARGVSFTLSLVGRGPELDRLSRRIAATRSIETRNAFLAPDEAIAEFQRAAIVVLPYLDATQSGVAAAAFANGRPVVASRIGGLVDAVQGGVDGEFVEPGNPTALADMLQRLLSAPGHLQRLTEGACMAATTRFDWERIAGELTQSFSMLAACPAREMSF